MSGVRPSGRYARAKNIHARTRQIANPVKLYLAFPAIPADAGEIDIPVHEATYGR
jgi:hypothetical protein